MLDLYQVVAANYRKALDEIERLRPGQEKPKDYAAECAMKCTEPAFKKYMQERHGLDRPLTDHRVVTKLRSILNIRSRAELNNDPAAAARWQNLRADFDAWRRR